MQPQAITLEPALKIEPDTRFNTQLHGPARWIARLLWCATALLLIPLFFAALPYYYTNHRVSCTTQEDCVPLQLRVEDVPFLHELGISLDGYAAFYTTVVTFSASVYFIMAGVLFWRKSDDWLAIFTSLFMLSFGATWSTVLTSLERVYPIWQPVGHTFAIFSLVSTFVVFYIFPTGQFVPSWTRFLVPLALAVGIAQPASLFEAAPPWQSISFIVLLISAIYAQIYRYRRVSNGIQRQQTKWGMWAGILSALCALIVVGLLLVLPHNEPGTARIMLYVIAVPLLLELARTLCPLALAAAILRYRLWDIDIIISRTLVYGVLTAATFSIYILVVGLLSSVWQSQDNFVISMIGTGFVAVLFQPLRQRIQQFVKRLLYGDRDDPYTVLSRLGQRLENTLSPNAVLTLIVTTVKEALNLPYAAISLLSNEVPVIATAAGTAPPNPVSVPLVYQHETVGQLLLGQRTPGESFSSADWRLLDDLARHAGLAVSAVRLTTDLQQARERLVTTREEERRRLRNELHDRLGMLAAVALKVGSVRELAPRDTAALDALLCSIEAEIGAAVADLRDLAYQLRPPVIDQLGLVEALRALVAQVQQTTQHYTVSAPHQLPPLPAAIEVALYRITQEALANVVRHAQARSCQVRLWIDDQVFLEITDDGVGISAEARTGVGLTSMRERAEEVGGTCDFGTVLSKGTCIRVSLPLNIPLSNEAAVL